MKREVSFFKDRRSNSAQAFIEACRMVGMSDSDIKAELMAIKRQDRVMIHIPECPKCGAKGFDVTADELKDAGGIIACNFCETLINPAESQS